MIDVSKMGIEEILTCLREKKFTCKELVEYYISNIEKYSDKNAILQVFDDAIEKAEEADAKLNSGDELPSLCGLPIIIKDNILYEGKVCSCASLFLKDYVAQYNSTAVQKLLDAGVVIIARANMDEFAMGGSCENSAYGACKNAYDDNRVSGGSSGGSAVCVALDMCAAALGSDTGGSVRQPASFNGLVGMKPSYGRVSRFGLVAFASSLDQIGPITKSVRDNAIILSTICGGDKNDDTSLKCEREDFLKYFTGSVKGLKVAVIKETLEHIAKTDYADIFTDITKWLESEGATVSTYSIKDFELALPVYYTIAPAEATSNLSRFDGIKYSRRSEKATDVESVYTLSRTEGFGKEVKRRIMLGNFVLSSGFYDAYYLKAKNIQAALRKEYEAVLSEADVIILPTTFGEAFEINAKTSSPVEMYVEDLFTISANVTGLPAISVPCGKGRNNLPLGLQIIGRNKSEGCVYNVADYFERNYKGDK